MNRRERLALLLVATVTAFLLPAGAEPSHRQLMSVSLPALHIAAEERVVGFDFAVTSGRIAQIPDMPIGWNISVNNDPSWNTKIDASIIVAAAAVDASFFKEFVLIEKDESSENPFEVKGEVIVSTDFSEVRRIRVEMKDFTTKKRTGRANEVPR
jgi:hypothetical protein